MLTLVGLGQGMEAACTDHGQQAGGAYSRLEQLEHLDWLA